MKWFAVFVYVCIMVGVGYVSMKKTKTLSDFFLGDRAVGPWLSAFAYGTTYFSAVLFVGYAGKLGWGFGLSDLWIVAGNTALGSFLAWKVLAKPTRSMTERLNVMTMPQFLSERYDSKAMKIVSAVIIFIFLVPYSAGVYMGLTYLFEKVFGIPYVYALLFMAGLTGIYLTMGGYLAVALNDFIQGVIMVFGAVALVFFILKAPEVSGLATGFAKLTAINPDLTRIVPSGTMNIVMLFSLVILTSFGTWGMPQMVQKFYAIKNEESIKPATIISTLFAAVIAFSAYFTGSLSRLFFDKLPIGVDGNPTPDLLMPMIMTKALPELVVVIILLLVLSASMSTLASLVLVSSSAITVDLIQGVFKPDVNKKSLLTLSRVLSLVFIGVSVYLALKPRLILTLMALSWGAVAGSFLAPYVWGLFSKKVTNAGAWAGMLSGLGIMVVLSLIFDPKFIPIFGCLAMIIPIAIVPLVSMFTEPFTQRHLLKVFGAEGLSVTPSRKSEVA